MKKRNIIKYLNKVAALSFTAVLLLCGCSSDSHVKTVSAGGTAETTETTEISKTSATKASAAEPEDTDIIATIGDYEIPYSLYKHYYQACANSYTNEDGEWSETELSDIRSNTETLLLSDVVFFKIADKLGYALDEDELASIDDQIAQTVASNAAYEGMQDLLAYRLQSMALDEKMYLDLYTEDYKQTAIHVKRLYVPYTDTSDEGKASTNQLVSLVPAMVDESTTFDSLAKSFLTTDGAYFDDLYLTDGDIGQGAYDMVKELELGELTTPFTTTGDGVYLLQRVGNDEQYINDNIADLLDNSTQFASLYQLLVNTMADSLEISYDEDLIAALPEPTVSK